MELSREKLVEKARQHKFAPLIIAVFLLAVGLRYYPVRNLEYLQALDPYNLFRMSQEIAYTGSLPDLDFMRYFPYAAPTYTVHIGNLAIPAVFYWLGGSFLFENYLSFAHVIIPVFSGLAAVTMYFLGKELYNKTTGLSAAFFIAVLPGAMFRSSAGFFEKEPTGTLLMIASLLFFTMAWKRKNWAYGILSGLSLGLFTTTWGGSQMMWLLYPLIIGFMLLIDQDIEQLVKAYTPTVLVGGGLAAIVNPGNFWFTDQMFILAAAFAALLWMRYLVEELELISESRLPYFVPGTYFFGAIAMLLSPLYSDTLANIMLGLYSSATQTGGSVIGGTVAENAPAALNEMVSQLGSGIVDQLFPGAELLTALTGTWTFAFLAIPLMLTGFILMLAKRYDVVSGLEGKKFYSLISGIIAAWAVGFSVFFAGQRLIGLVLMAAISGIIAAVVYYLDEDSAFSISSMALLFTAIVTTMFAFSQQNPVSAMRSVAYPVWISSIGLGVIYYLEDFKSIEISLDWYKVIPLFWLGSNLLGTTARSRLLYLAAFPVALGAGYTFSIVLNRIQELDFSELGLNTGNTRFILVAVLVAGAISINAFAGLASAQNVNGSPNEAWMQNLDYLEQEAPNGSVVMSWWDYGYHFQSIGRTGTVADGGNFRYYTNDNNPVNYPLADYFTSSSTENHTEFLDKHSVDYIVLDNTMIGKYQAVSQISREDNQAYYSMYQASTQGSLENAISESGNRTVATFSVGPDGAAPPVVDQEPNDPGTRAQQYAEIYVPFNQSNGSIEVSDPATIRYYSGQEEEVNCVLTENGEKSFGDGDSDYCVAIDPFYSFENGIAGSQTRVALVPQDIKDHTLVKLYLMDGHDIPYAEKVEEGSNGFIRMWAVE